MVESEQLEVLGEGDGDGWIRARNYRGQEGYVPSNYLDIEYPVAQDEAAQQLSTAQASFQLASQISFSSVDYTVDEEPSEVSTGIDTVREINKPSNLGKLRPSI